VQWYHEADREAAAFVRPSRERIELVGDSVTLVPTEDANSERDGERPAVERVVLRTFAYAFDHELRAEGATRRVQFRGRAFKITHREIADSQ
jgi:hypothetical protein